MTGTTAGIITQASEPHLFAVKSDNVLVGQRFTNNDETLERNNPNNSSQNVVTESQKYPAPEHYS